MVKPAAAALLCVLAATPAGAAGWSKPEWSLRLDGRSTSDRFPGSAATGPDRGLESEVSLATGARLGQPLKLGLEGRAGGETWQRFEQARSSWLGGALSLRRGGAQIVGEAEWTPRRVKFADDAGDAVFRRFEWRLGLRPSLPGGLRLRAEGRFTRDDYAAAFDARDALARGAYAQLAWRPTPQLALRADADREHTAAAAAKYIHDDWTTGGSVDWRRPPWRLETTARSAIRRYRDARPSDSNFRRRDQRLEATGSLGRLLRPGLELSVGASLVDQASSRLDRNYTVSSFRLGLAWTGAGN